MIRFFSGTPGSGKSFHVAKEIYWYIREGRNIIANFPIDTDCIKQKRKTEKGKFEYRDNREISVKYLIEYAVANHVEGKEKQTVVVLDECQVLFNPREFSRSDRMDWIKFFTVHRHLGFDFILVSQNDRLVDRQIRSLFEYEVKHRKVNNFKWAWMIPVPLFAAIQRWYGVNEKMGSEFFFYRKKFGAIYNSYRSFSSLHEYFPDLIPAPEEEESEGLSQTIRNIQADFEAVS